MRPYILYSDGNGNIFEDTSLYALGRSGWDAVEVDEADWIDPGMLNEFWASVYPIISSSKKSKIVMCSTPRDTSGLFYKIYAGAVKD